MDKYYLGIDIGGTKTAFVLYDKDMSIQFRDEFKTLPEKGFQYFLDNVKKRFAKYENRKIASVGISIGGPLDAKNGIIYDPPNLKWGIVNIVEELEKIIHSPIFIEQDANAGVLAEYYLGAGRGLNDVVFLTLGTGLGAGIIVNKKLVKGSSNFAGEIGHIRLADTGPLLYGKRGSWESLCSGSGIARLAEYHNPVKFENMTTKDVSQLAIQGDKDAINILKLSGKMMGKGLAIIFDLLDPDVIILGNIGWKLPDLWLKEAFKEVEKEALIGEKAIQKIKKSDLREKIGDYASLLIAKIGFEGRKDGLQKIG